MQNGFAPLQPLHIATADLRIAINCRFISGCWQPDCNVRTGAPSVIKPGKLSASSASLGDIKPENILYETSRQAVRIADFGESRSLRARSAPHFTHAFSFPSFVNQISDPFSLYFATANAWPTTWPKNFQFIANSF